MNIIDISLNIDEHTVIYPNNPEYKVRSAVSGSGNQISEITIGSHTATHLDAPKHADSENGKAINEMDLNIFYGDCKVFDFSHVEEKVTVEDLKAKKIEKGDRILLKTYNSQRGYSEFYKDFIFLDGKAAKYLAEIGIVLLGIDYLSVKQSGSPDNTPHTNLLDNEIAILEGINLKEVEEGKYTLCALPLKLVGLDGSPTRAVLVEKEENK